jgi:poly [ADP-ribose] polymerase
MSGTVWDATLNQTNVCGPGSRAELETAADRSQINGNNNKFYYIQLLERDDKSLSSYATFCHWGRVGEKGQSQFKCQGTSLLTAIAAFDKQMKSKSGSYLSLRAFLAGRPNVS